MAPQRTGIRQAVANRRSRFSTDRGIDVDFLPDVGKDKEKMLEIIGAV